jgi:type IV secretion system protein VirB2
MEWKQKAPKEVTICPRKGDKLDKVLDCTANTLVLALILLPQLAHAQDATGTFGGITAFLRSITQLLIFDWGYYIGIITLAIQGFRWKTGRIDLMTLGGWGLGIGLVFFAPNIVGDLRNRAGNAIV